MSRITVFFLLILSICCFCSKNPLVDSQWDISEERILFFQNTRNNSKICAMKPDGSDIIDIGNYEFGISGGRWSPDKSKIVVETSFGYMTEYQQLWLMDLRGNFLRQLTSSGYRAAWGTSNDFITYLKGQMINDIFRINISSMQIDTLLDAEISPDKSYYNYLLCDINPNNDKELLLIEYYNYENSEGKSANDDGEIILYDYSSKQKKYLTDNELNDGHARISPDGENIIYSITSENSNYKNNLYLMSIEGQYKEKLTNYQDIYLHTSFAWSPDSKKVAFSRSERSTGYNPYYDIFIIDIDTKEILQITNNAKDGIPNKVIDWR